METLVTISSKYHDEYSQTANGICSILKPPDNLNFGLNLSHLVFCVAKETFLALRAKNTAIQEAFFEIDMAKSFLRQGEDGAFESIYCWVVIEYKNLNREPVLPRFRNPPKRFNEGVRPHHFATAKEQFRAQYLKKSISLTTNLIGDLSNI